MGLSTYKAVSAERQIPHDQWLPGFEGRMGWGGGGQATDVSVMNDKRIMEIYYTVQCLWLTILNCNYVKLISCTVLHLYTS